MTGRRVMSPPSGPWADLGLRVLPGGSGGGRIVLALGDPARARHVAVLVPGAGVGRAGLEHPSDPRRGPLGWARALHARAGPHDTAVVVWAGYRRPPRWHVEALRGTAARAGVAVLAASVDRIRGRSSRPVHLTLVGHGYGAVLVAAAAPALRLSGDDDLVLLGAPGARVGHVRELGTDARVWAGRARRDPVRLLPPVRIGDLGHGRDPSAPAFGARPLDVRGVRAHDRYFDPGSASLATLARVVVGGGVAAPHP